MFQSYVFLSIWVQRKRNDDDGRWHLVQDEKSYNFYMYNIYLMQDLT